MRASTIGALALSAAVGIAVLSYSTLSLALGDSGYEDGQTVEVAPFDGVVLAGGGDITVKPGDSYSVKIIEGADSLKLTVDDGTLKVGCIRPCPRRSYHEVEVTTTGVETLVIAGGGAIRVDGTFEEREDLSVVITGGGSIDAFGAPAREVDVAITGGGDINVSASDELDVAIIGGGSIQYKGDPEIDRSIIGGGSISKK